MDLFSLVARLTMDTSGFDQGVQRSRGVFSSLSDKLSAGTVMLGNLASKAVEKGIDAVINLGKTGIEYNAQMEDYTTNFAVMLGSTEAAAKKVESLKEMAAKTPFEMSDLASATQTLLAFGIESDNVDHVLQMLGDVSLGNTQKFNGLALAFGQMSSTGKLMGQDLNQMINQGFNPLQIIAEKTGASMGDLKSVMSGQKTSREFQKAIKAAKAEVKRLGDGASDSAKMLAQIGEDGAISADMVMQAFEIATAEGGKFYGGMEEASKTYNGMMATLSDNIHDLIGKAFKPVNDYMTTTLLPQAIEWVDTISQAYETGGLAAALDKAKSILSGLAQSLIEKAPDAFGAAAEAIVNALVGAINAAFGGGIVIPFDVSEIVSSGVGNVISFIGDTLQWIGDNGDFVKAALEVIAAGIIAVNVAANPVGAALKIIQIALLAIIMNWDSFKESVVGGAVIDAFNGIAGAIGNASSQWDDFALAVARAYDKDGFTGMFSEIWTAVSGIATDIGEAYNNFALFIATKANEAWVASINAIKDSFYSIGVYLSTTYSNFKSFIDSVVPQGLLDAFDKIKTAWQEISGAISSAIANIKEFFGLNEDEKGFGGGRSSGNGAGRHIPVGNHAVGLDYVPRDNYMANLHRGEAVLTRGEAEEWRRDESGGRGGVTVVQNIYAQEQTAAELMQEAYWQQERAVLMGV